MQYREGAYSHAILFPSRTLERIGLAGRARARRLPTVSAVLGHASLNTTAIGAAEARELVSRVWP